MAKVKTEAQTGDEQRFPSRILYSSPPEASNLKAWVRDVERKRNGNGSTSQEKSDTD